MTTQTAVRRHPLADLLTVMWHYVREPSAQPLVGATSVEPSAFDAQLDLITTHRTVVAWSDVAAALDGGPSLPTDAALLTFDDGLADHARTVAPRLVDRGLPGVFFVMARRPGEPLTVGHAIHILLADLGAEGLRDAVDVALRGVERDRFRAMQERERAAGVDSIDVLKRPLQRDLLATVEPVLSRLVEERHGPDGDVADALHLSTADIGAMRRDGLTVGGHGRRHLWLDHEPSARVVDEIEASASFLADEPRPWAFAYPYGASSAAATNALSRTGFASAFQASPRAAAGAYDLGRVDAEDPAFESIVNGTAR
ncbi:MAG TPA: polysaccharide deacetylase family protein [Candidatus Limnocylindrales bacterium]